MYRDVGMTGLRTIESRSRDGTVYVGKMGHSHNTQITPSLLLFFMDNINLTA